MSVLEENTCYGLSSRKLVSHGGNISVFHVKLTDSASRSLDTFQSTKDRLSHPIICFTGNQGRFTIPCSENETRTFTFCLADVARESPHGSFDCVQQPCSGEDNRLSSVGVIQKKITVNATDDSYHKARQSMAQAEEETRSRGAIVIKHTGRVRGKKVTVRAPAPALASLAKPRPFPTCHPSRHRGGPEKLPEKLPEKSVCTSQPRSKALCRRVSEGKKKKKAGAGGGVTTTTVTTTVTTAVEQRPLRERVVHLLALRPYRRAELVLRLQRDGLETGDKGGLDALLLEVGQINSKDSTYILQDCLYKELQRDWPGYTAGDQQLLKRILVRRLFQPHHHLSVPGAQVSPLRDTPNSSPAHATRPPPAHATRPPPVEDYTDPLASRRPRIAHAGSAGPSPAPSTKGVVAEATKGGGGDEGRAALLDPRRLFDSLSAAAVADKRLEPADGASGPPSEGVAPATAAAEAPPPPSPTRTPRKRRKSKHRDQEPVKGEDRKKRKSGSSPEDLSLDCADPSGMFYDSSVLQAANHMTDYLSTYTVICTADQRLRYKKDFNEEYSEYRSLHSRIDSMTQQFMGLDVQLRRLRHGSQKYKTIHNQILQEYCQIKKSNPNYNQDKIRCEYLHNKLAHIKKLISEYDRQQLCIDSS